MTRPWTVKTGVCEAAVNALKFGSRPVVESVPLTTSPQARA